MMRRLQGLVPPASLEPGAEGVGSRAPGGPDDVPRTVLDSLARSNQLLEAILAELRAARQVGAVYPISVTITGGQWVEHTFDPSLFALTIVNDGPANAEWRLPFQAPTAGIVILPTEVATISLNRALIRSVGLRVAVGTSNLRIVGIY